MSRFEKPEYERVGTEESRSPFVFHIGSSFSSSDRVRLRYHGEMEIKYVKRGPLSVNLGSQIVCAEAGELVIVNPYEYHSNLVEQGEAKYDMLCVDISESCMGGLYADFFLPYREGKFRFPNLIKDASVIKKACDLFSALEKGEDLLFSLGLFSVFFASLLPYKEQPMSHLQRDPSPRRKEFIYKTFSYIHERYAESIRLSDLASRCYMTEAHFSRTFKELMGEPPIAYINRYRINRATVLLSTTALSLKEIAERVGFSDEAYFSRAFKKYKGESPTAYLKSEREE